ncbi:endonuclease domain-containing protein [Subtercola boreus]|uniref:DUF559 domain-containing protein n=1 Tax=Subtercola boreus TaxID=120213 RepID=A0A3E0WEL8_9MICO|nr:DUF559 domain-containing protein [Subtercola boreus]RFA22554.1 hypothetical protein B7R24_02705 [Subtercola boreus]RFA22910.1 hypothetical protein B7R23_02700 [Subtercola boreus]RFA28661.1 hypothetical protein B7R25_02715 [Subtercola boreus]
MRGHQAVELPIDVTQRFGLPVAGAATTWLQLSRELSLGDLVAVGDHLVLEPKVPDGVEHRPYTSIDELRRRSLEYKGPGCSAARRAVGMLRQGAESRPETLLRLLLHAAGLPEPEVNPEIWHSAGYRIGRADLVHPRWRVIVEYDGDQHRTDTTQYEKDMWRVEQFTRDNWDVIRIRKHGLFADPHGTQALVREALARAGWRAP